MVTGIVLTKDEEKNIVDCLESLSFCDEIIVIDDNSHDRTQEIAKSMNAKVFSHSLGNNFSQQRNYALEKSSNEWVLFVDADEVVGPELANEILSFLKNSKGFVGACIKRRDFMWGKILKYGETGDARFVRLGKKDCGRWVDSVHEIWNMNGSVATLKNSIDHFPHQSVADFLREINYYTDIRANDLFMKGTNVKWYHILFYPNLKFIQNYFLRLGFMDGLPGFVFALMMSFHSFLVRGKLWQLNQRK